MAVDNMRMGVVVYGVIRSGTTLVSDLLTIRGKSLVIDEPDLFVNWHERTAARIDNLLKAFGLPATKPPDQQMYASYATYFEKIIIPELKKLDQWGIKQVNFLGWRNTLDRYEPKRLILCVRDIRDVVLSAMDLIIWQKLAFPGTRYLRDEGWILARLCHDVFELMALKKMPHFLARYEDLVSKARVRENLREFVGLDELGSERLNLQMESGRNRLEGGKHGKGVSKKSVGRYHREPSGPAKALAEYIWRLLPEYSRAFGYETPDDDEVLTHPFANPHGYGSNPVHWKMVDTWNWNGPDIFDPAFARRRARLVAAANISPGTDVLDVGAVLPVFSYLLEKSCRCRFTDSTERIPGSLSAQWMTGEFPSTDGATLLTAIGVLEFVEDMPEFLQGLRKTKIPALVSYHATDDTGEFDRSALGWRSHLSREEMEDLLEGCGFKVKTLWGFDGRQSLFLLS